MENTRNNLPKRKNIRLKNYDYSHNGAYFITICTNTRENLLGEIVGQVHSCRLSAIGNFVDKEIAALTQRFVDISINKYVIMPNHIHIIVIIERTRQGQSPCPTICDIIGAFKSITTKKANLQSGTPGRKIWQPRYHDHVIRNENDYLAIWQYIDTNPQKWQEDRYYG